MATAASTPPPRLILVSLPNRGAFTALTFQPQHKIGTPFDSWDLELGIYLGFGFWSLGFHSDF